MKILKNYQKTIFGVKYKLFTVIFNDKTKQYCYYTNALWTSNVGDCMIYKNKEKSKFFNKYTMSIIGIFYTIYTYTFKWPLLIILIPFKMYFEGGKNFILDTAWYQYVRFFNWTNIVIIIALILILVIKI